MTQLFLNFFYNIGFMPLKEGTCPLRKWKENGKEDTKISLDEEETNPLNKLEYCVACLFGLPLGKKEKIQEYIEKFKVGRVILDFDKLCQCPEGLTWSEYGRLRNNYNSPEELITNGSAFVEYIKTNYKPKDKVINKK